jgi:hypothetical protein
MAAAGVTVMERLFVAVVPSASVMSTLKLNVVFADTAGAVKDAVEVAAFASVTEGPAIWVHA